MRSFGEWMFDSLRAKPVRTSGYRGRRARRRAGSPRPCGRAAAARRAPPRTRRARAATARAHRAGRARGRRRPERRRSTSAPAGAASRSSRSNAGAITAGSWPPTSRIETFASASTGITVFCRTRRAALDPVHVDGRLGPGAEVELLGGGGIGRTASRLPRSRPRPRAARSSPRAPLGRRHDARPQRLGQHARRAAARPTSACISACIAFSEAPPYMPEWRSRARSGP